MLRSDSTTPDLDGLAAFCKDLSIGLICPTPQLKVASLSFFCYAFILEDRRLHSPCSVDAQRCRSEERTQ